MPIIQGTITETRQITGPVNVDSKEIAFHFLSTQTAHSLVNQARDMWLREVFPSCPEGLRISARSGRWEYIYAYHPHNDDELYKDMRPATEAEIELMNLFTHAHSLITETTK